MSDERSPARHYCDHSDCGKSFRRAEHLNRHKLNHTNSTIKCPQCDHLFYRRDLLKRHLILKHKRGSRPAHAAEETSPSLNFEVSPPGPHESFQSLVQPAYDLQEQEDLRPSDGIALAEADAVDEIAVADIAGPMSGDVFPFASPGLDLVQDWGWFSQFPFPIMPVNPGGHTLVENSISELQCLDDDWTKPNNPQGLHISQEVLEYILSLISVVEVPHAITPEDATSILNAAFVFFTEAMPIFHQPTFSFELIHSELCASIFCVGLLIAHEQASHKLGCTLLGQTRSKLLDYVDKNTIYLADLEVLQAMLLVEFSGMYLAERTAMEMSDIFHGTLVTLCRRLGLFEMTSSNGVSDPVLANGNERQTFLKQESAKRLAYFVFALDVEHALLFGHDRTILSVYSMKLELPSEEGDWQGLTTGLQPALYPSTRQNKYHLLCHNFLSSNSNTTDIIPYLTPLSSFLVLLGLASVALDLLRRQQDPFINTRHAIVRLGTVLPAIHDRLINGPDGSMKFHGRVVYHITAIALCTPLEDLERAANDGFSRTGRTPKQHARAAIIRLLTKHKVGVEPARHAINLLKLYLMPDAQAFQSSSFSDNGTGTSPTAGHSRYEPSALYFGVLTLWAYVIGRVSEEDDYSIPMDESRYLPNEDIPTVLPAISALPRQDIGKVLQSLEEALDKDDSRACRREWRVLVQYVAMRLASRWSNNAVEYSQVLKSLSDNLIV